MKSPQPKPRPKLNIKVSKFRPPHPKWQTIQQVLRTAAYVAGGTLLGESIAESDIFQAAVGGFVSIIAFIWWWYWEVNRASDSSAQDVSATVTEADEPDPAPTETPTPKEKPK